MRVAGGDIGWIRDDQVESFAGNRREPVAVAEIDRRTQASGVVARDGNGPTFDVDRNQCRCRAFQCQRDGDDAGTGAEIEDSRRLQTVQPFQRISRTCPVAELEESRFGATTTTMKLTSRPPTTPPRPPCPSTSRRAETVIE